MLLTVVKQIVKLSNLLISNLFLSDNPALVVASLIYIIDNDYHFYKIFVKKF